MWNKDKLKIINEVKKANRVFFPHWMFIGFNKVFMLYKLKYVIFHTN